MLVSRFTPGIGKPPRCGGFPADGMPATMAHITAGTGGGRQSRAATARHATVLSGQLFIFTAHSDFSLACKN